MHRASQRRTLGGIAALWSLLGTLAGAQAISPADPGARINAPTDANRPFAQELASSNAPDLVIALAGSLLVDGPAATLPPWDRQVTDLLDGAAFPGLTTVAVADLQTTLIEPPLFGGYPYPWDGPRAYAAPPGIARELRDRGLAMLARANSHALDWGIEGMRATDTALDAAGLKHAGTGEQEGQARMASYLEQPAGKGRIALLATATAFRPTTTALSAHGVAPGRAGISGIELSPLRRVPVQQRAQLQQLACRFQYPGAPQQCEHLPPPPATVTLFGSRFESATVPGEEYTTAYEVNHVQVANELRAVREAKQNSDLVVLSLATGQPEPAEPRAAEPPTALVGLAHALIGAGADLVVATGRSALGPIEIYPSAEGPPRPILYGLGRLYCSPGAAPAAPDPAEEDSIIVRSSSDRERLRLEIYPIDLRDTDGTIGVPHLAAAARASTTLARLQQLSAPYHTVIRTEPYGPTVRGVIVVEVNPGSGGVAAP